MLKSGAANLTAQCAMCLLALASPVALRAQQEHARTASLAGSASKSTALSGFVVDTVRKPIDAADVAIPALGLSTKTDPTGRFRLADIPAGTHRVVVRSLGYVAADASIAFVDGKPEARRFELQRVEVLDSVAVKAERLDANGEDFALRRRTGVGTFLAREQLAQFDQRALGRIIAQLPGARAIRGRGNMEVLASSRYAGSANGSTRPCYAKIFVDNIPMYRGSLEEPLFDLNTIPIDQVEAVEYFAGAAQVPARYGGLGAGCGVMVIWMRKGG